MFLILGIGADDCFVFVDAWKQSVQLPQPDHPAGATEAERERAREAQRLESAYRHSAQARAPYPS